MNQKLVWQLNELYENEDDFYNEINKLDIEINKTQEFKKIVLDHNSLLTILNLKWNIKERANKLLIYGSLNYYKNINLEETINMKKTAEVFVSKVDSLLSFIDEQILELGKEKIDDFMKVNKKLSTYELYLNNIFRKKNHIQIQNDAVNIKVKELNDSINNNLTNYNNLIHEIILGTIVVGEEEIQLSPSNIGKYLSSRDRETRRKAYISVNEAYQKCKDLFASILNSIYIDRVNISDLEKYSSVLEKNMFDENINPEILTILIKSVHENLKLIHEYLKIKSDHLLISDPHLYDYGIPFNNDKRKKYSLEDAITIIKEALSPLGEEYLNIIDYLIDNHHIDAILDKNKHQAITFSWSSYSFMNYREAYIDLKNFAHELGHIVNAYLSEQNQPYIYSDSTIFVGETASLVNELLLNKYLLEHATNEEEKLFYLSANIDNYFIQIFKQTMYTEFENKLYNYAKNNTELTPDLLEKEYLDLLKEYYGEFTIYDNCSSAEWTRLGHLFRWSYYVYNYATGLIMASSVADSIINKKPGFIDKYLEFLSSGSNNYSLELLKKIDIDLTDKNIISNSLELLREYISEFHKILSKNN